jgi:hypothetical protein
MRISLPSGSRLMTDRSDVVSGPFGPLAYTSPRHNSVPDAVQKELIKLSLWFASRRKPSSAGGSA